MWKPLIITAARGGYQGGQGGYQGNRDNNRSQGGYQRGGYQGNRETTTDPQGGGYQGNRDLRGGYQEAREATRATGATTRGPGRRRLSGQQTLRAAIRGGRVGYQGNRDNNSLWEAATRATGPGRLSGPGRLPGQPRQQTQGGGYQGNRPQAPSGRPGRLPGHREITTGPREGRLPGQQAPGRYGVRPSGGGYQAVRDKDARDNRGRNDSRRLAGAVYSRKSSFDTPIQTKANQQNRQNKNLYKNDRFDKR